MNVINEIEREYIKYDDLPFQVGDLIKVHVKIIEGKRERIQIFEGYVMMLGTLSI